MPSPLSMPVALRSCRRAAPLPRTKAPRRSAATPVGRWALAWHFAGMTDPEAPVSAGDFRSATEADWRKLVDAALKGGSFERLKSSTYDGLTVEPLYSP